MVLNAFMDSGEFRPMGMTAWGKALLHALYSTPQRNKKQLLEMQSAAFREIAAKAQPQALQ
jgi:hypothetical protein